MKTRLLTYCLLAFALTLIYLFGSLVINEGLRDHALEADYNSFLLGGRLLADRHAAATTLYNLAIQQQTQQAMLIGTNIHFPDGLLPFLNPPFVALLIFPLTSLPPGIGFLIWDAVQLLLLLVSLSMVGAMLPSKYRYLLWLGAFAFLPVYQSLLEGQLSPTVLLGIILLWRGLRAGGSGNWWGGVGLTLCLVKPQLLPVLILYLLYKRNWRALGGFAGGGLFFYLLCAVVSGVDWTVAYLNALIVSQAQGYGYAPGVMFNLTGLLDRLNLGSVLLLAVLSTTVIAVLLYSCWRSDGAGSASGVSAVGQLEMQLAAVVLAAALTSVHLYTHDLTMLLFSGAVLLGWAAQAGWPTWISALLVANLLAPLLIFIGQPFDTLFIATILLAFGASLYILIHSPARLAPTAPNQS